MVEYKVAGRPVKLNKGEKSDGTDWTVTFKNGKTTSLANVLALIEPKPELTMKENVGINRTLTEVKKLGLDDTITPDMWDQSKIEAGRSGKYTIRYPDWFKKDHKIINYNSILGMIFFDHPAHPKRSDNWVNSFLKDEYRVDLSDQPRGMLQVREEKERKLTYDDFVSMVRADMNAGSAPDEYVSDERVRRDAKWKYNEYLQGTSLDDLFLYEATEEEEDEFHKELDKLVHKTFGHSSDEKPEKKSKFKKHGEMAGFDMRGINESTTHEVKYSKSNDTYQVWSGDEIVTDFATKKRADAEAKRLNALQDVKNSTSQSQSSSLIGRMGDRSLKESTINEVKKMTFGAYLDDLDNRFVDLMKAAKGLNAEGSQEINMRATINQNFTLFRNYISALKKEYSNELNKELTFSMNEAKATCCHRCGRVHVKGSGCKKPYLKGKDSCAIKEVQDLQERFDSLKETKSAPEGHYFTKSGNLVKGRMTKAAEERGARKSDPKDKMRSKIPKVTQYTEIVKEYIKSNPKMKKSKMTEAIKNIINTNN